MTDVGSILLHQGDRLVLRLRSPLGSGRSAKLGSTSRAAGPIGLALLGTHRDTLSIPNGVSYGSKGILPLPTQNEFLITQVRHNWRSECASSS
jgi:hypothetical protein